MHWVLKKEKTWCGALVEFCSQIKYSLIFSRHWRDQAGSDIDGVSHISQTVTATRTFSTWNAMPMVCGWTTIGRNRTTSGIRRMCLCSASESLFFPPRFYSWRFFFSPVSKFFFQPPNILPTSSSLLATSSICWFDISLPSQATEIRNLRMSKVRIHSEIFSAVLSQIYD